MKGTKMKFSGFFIWFSGFFFAAMLVDFGRSQWAKTMIDMALSAVGLWIGIRSMPCANDGVPLKGEQL